MKPSRLFDRAFLKDALSLSGGTAIAQIIAIATLPVLTRMYAPEEFGVLALFMASVSILSIFASLGIEQAIMLPKEEHEAANLLMALIFSSLVFSLLMQGIIFIFDDTLLQWLGNAGFKNYLYYIPTSLFLISSYQGLRFWQMRQQSFKLISISIICAVTANFVVSILIRQWAEQIDFVSDVNGLIIGYIVQYSVNTLILLKGTKKQSHYFSAVTVNKIIQSIKPHKKLIATLLFSHGIVAVGYSRLPILAIGSLFDHATLGFYSMVERIVAAPSALIANAIGDVFRQRAAVAWREKGRFDDIFWKTLLITTAIAIPIYSLGIFAAPYLFVFALGDTWHVAGDYAQIMLVASMFQFITVPVDKGAVIVGANKFIFIWNCLRLLGVVSIIITVFLYNIDIYTMIFFLTLNNILAYFINLFFERKFSVGCKFNY